MNKSLYLILFFCGALLGEQKYLDYKSFAPESFKGVGGATGSMAAKNTDDGRTYQLKKSIKDARLVRNLKAFGSDKENFGEVIASAVSRALPKSVIGQLELIPEVFLVYDQSGKRILIASRYLNNPVGDIRNVTQKKMVKFSKLPFKDDDKAWDISGENSGQLRQDLARAIVVSALSGDHDINSGNMFIVTDDNSNQRIARIDFGHAFNDLLTYKSALFGGQKYSDNRILDYLNREKVNAIGGSISKLWGTYLGLIPSQEMLDALRTIGKVDPDSIERGIAAAEAQFESLVETLKKDEKNKDVLEHIKKSLISINDNISDVKVNQNYDTNKVLSLVFKNIFTFYLRGQEQMREVADLMELQLEIDRLLKEDKTQFGFLPGGDMTNMYDKLTKHELLKVKGGITWLKTDKNKKAFKGNLLEYIKERKAELKQ